MYEIFQKREHISSEIENLTVITNPNPNSIISHFGYCNGLISERGEDYCTKIICIKYKGEDEWRKIYQYKSAYEFNNVPGLRTDFYENNGLGLVAFIPLKTYDQNLIFELIKENQAALEVFKDYLKRVDNLFSYGKEDKDKTLDSQRKRLKVMELRNPKSNISHLGYCNYFYSETGEDYSAEHIICIKYKDEDEWRKIYQCKFKKEFNGFSKSPYVEEPAFCKYDSLEVCLPLNKKEKKVILDFAKDNQELLEIFNGYLSNLEEKEKETEANKDNFFTSLKKTIKKMVRK